VVGLLSRFFYPGKVPMSWLSTLCVGVGSAILGNVLGWALGIGSMGLVGSILIGILILFLVKKYKVKI